MFRMFRQHPSLGGISQVHFRVMGQFDNLPGVFELARVYRKTEGDGVHLTYDEYIRFLSIWNDLPDRVQNEYMNKARIRSKF